MSTVGYAGAGAATTRATTTTGMMRPFFTASKVPASTDGRAQKRDLLGRELARFAWGEVVRRQARVARAVQAYNRVPDGLEHPLDLVLAALVDGHFDAGRSDPADASGSAAAVLELDAFGQAA